MKQLPVGIDLGTTYTVAAYLDKGGRPATVPNEDGSFLTRSALLFDESVLVGTKAVEQSRMQPERYADCFKRDMGRPVYARKVCGQDVPPEVLSAFLLRHLRQNIERHLGSIERAVITVPAFFDETRRKATQDAAKLAGLEALDIINEPTAAALAYGFSRTGEEELTRPRRILIYDLGGGTFDVTILLVKGNRFRTLATDGDVKLGGRDFDQRVVDYVAKQFTEAHGTDPREQDDVLLHLLQDAELARHRLTSKASVTLECNHQGKQLGVEVTRDKFEELCRDLIARTETTTGLVVKDAGLNLKQLHHVLLVGGATRTPCVKKMLRRLTGKEAVGVLNPDQSVAKGAAIYAGKLLAQQSGDSSLDFSNVNSHSLGIVGLEPVTKRMAVEHVVPKNTTLPCRVAKKFHTSKENQRNVKINVVEGESTRVSNCIALGSCVVHDLPENLPARSPVIVELGYHANGRIHVSATIPQTRQTASVEIHRDMDRELGALATWESKLLKNDVPDEDLLDLS